MADPKKGMAMLILEHAKKKKADAGEPLDVPDTAEEDSESSADAGLESAMTDFMAALQGNDVEGAIEAWKSLKELG